MAPEQAMGKPSFCSDVFSLGLILYRMFSGELPEWPYEWPLPGLQADCGDACRRALSNSFARRSTYNPAEAISRRQQNARKAFAAIKEKAG